MKVLFCILLTFAVSNCFQIVRKTVVNGHEYQEILDQPFFRYFHTPHIPIPHEIVNETNFGVHDLPEDDVYVPHNWTEMEKKYLPCRDLACVCPMFNGTTKFGSCILPNGKPLKQAVRKELRTLTRTEWDQITKAFNAMKDSGLYDRVGFVHKYSGLHEGPGFFTWHREYLKRIEILLRMHLPMGSELGMPYWDSRIESLLPKPEQSTFFSKDWVGSMDQDGYVVDGAFAKWKTMEGNKFVQRFVNQKDSGEPFSHARVDYILSMENITFLFSPVIYQDTCPLMRPDDMIFEYSHDYVHDFINGDMKQSYSSSSEIIFFFHHTMVDHIWEMWRQQRQDRFTREVDYPPPIGECFPPAHFLNSPLKELEPYTNSDGLSNTYTDNMYKYADVPKCKSRDEECGSKYLFCYKDKSVGTRCQAKLNPGADCQGLEGYNACFDSTCIRGKCARGVPKKQHFWGKLWGM